MITFITGNEHKVKEAENIFKDYDIKLEHIDLGYEEPQGTLEEVAISGAKYASRKLGKPVIVEDAGLFIKALNGFPGTYSHYVQDTIGNQGILKLLTDADDRYAEFRSVIGYCAPNSEPKIFLGKVKGEIAVEERGDLGFAFDPLFYVPSLGKTFGELTTDEKNQFSHRKNSLEQFIKWYSTKE
ncbi:MULTISPECIES: XTP/dITP diphosphatase [Methanobrevibacter]|jgi:XTP/dITP diphosphohydrolase|uniref:dITP/XTP pyrophosphatase n=1 Tax=Methanobrevibacter thaueri TaxID=190975 RepID=A0A315XKC4_9EURY|nr:MULTISPECIES: XTP/dITP diphosphatase [Methanobrevibacter]MBR2666457.1 XTP/dITP diphosphatase [Methanobrevibacter sp.]MBR3197574.1 XTP/dITP diphosphatase [Methanobrevibacter sp.]MBR6928526.1 XTP/dITP diphosphatase [Methanobrevibacter sp.]PWB85515.1 Non-canonical purine NTP pyrophosphatase [Methanobrevibacter thaueri]